MKSDWQYSKPIVGFDSNGLPIFLDSWNNEGVKMKWNSGDPIVDGPYLCVVKGYSHPVLLYWQKSLTASYWSDNTNPWAYPKKYDVIYYMNLNDIPMPENW